MTQEHVANSLAAVEQALMHFHASLENAGFAQGARPYMRMSEVILAQAMTLQSAEDHQFDKGFLHVAELAKSVHEQLRPYSEAMERLLALEEIVKRPMVADIDPDSLGGKVVAVLSDAARPLSVTAIRAVTGKSTRTLRAELDSLLETGVVEKKGTRNRPVYELSR